ncbi:MAG: hydroxymyristoyl-ACP dehydratase [Alistipes sp.]|nr:hydroxymyristoyl-ACP dehydratase [Alistipes sp.]
MKLLDSLYTITSMEQTADGPTFTLELNAEHFIYKAHFPGEPITPGVCILQIAHELLEVHCATTLEIECVKNVKFLRVITPDATPVVRYAFQKIVFEENLVKCQVSVTAEDEALAKLSILFRKQD